MCLNLTENLVCLFVWNVKGHNAGVMQCSEQAARRNSDCQLVSRILASSLAHYFVVYQGRKCSHLPLLRCIFFTEFSVFQQKKRGHESRGRGRDKTRDGRFERWEEGHRGNSRIFKKEPVEEKLRWAGQKTQDFIPTYCIVMSCNDTVPLSTMYISYPQRWQ